MARTGRPTKLSPEIQAHIVKAIRVGVSRDDAFLSGGIDKQTGYMWLKRGREGDPIYSDFAQAVEKADSEFALNAMTRIASAASKQWQAAAWMLERKRPSEYGQRIKMTVDNELNQFLDKLSGTLPKDIYRKVLDIATATTGGSETSEVDAGGSADEDTDPEDSPLTG